MHKIPDAMTSSEGRGHGRLERKFKFDEEAWIERRRLAGKSIGAINRQRSFWQRGKTKQSAAPAGSSASAPKRA